MAPATITTRQTSIFQLPFDFFSHIQSTPSVMIGPGVLALIGYEIGKTPGAIIGGIIGIIFWQPLGFITASLSGKPISL